MAIMKWNTPPKGDAHDRHANVVGHGDGVSLAHAVSGEKVGGSGAQDTLGPNIELATKWSTAPYRGPDTTVVEPARPNVWGYRDPKREGKCMANDDTCNGSATVSSDRQWCAGHMKQKAKATE